MRIVTLAVTAFLASAGVSAFSVTSLHSGRKNDPSVRMAAAIVNDVTFLKPETTDIIQEDACNQAAQQMERILVPVSSTISESETVGISYIHFKSAKKSKAPPLVLVHGFDSSCLEYRRLGPKLAEQGIDVYAVDILGWGFTQLDSVSSFSAQSKIEALKSFVETKLGPNTPFCVGGASLGGAAAIELAAATSDTTCAGVVLIDAQGFVDGVGPMAALPKPLAKVGVQVLKSIPLRNSANQMSYYDKETFATEEAQVIGRLHCLQDGWTDAMVSFMQSGGFAPSTKIPNITAKTLVLWGRQDTILESKFAQQFIDTLPDGRLEWIEECGHVPHLEQPEATATVIANFLTTEVKNAGATGSASASTDEDGESSAVSPPFFIGAGLVTTLAAAEALELLSQNTP